MIAMTTRIFVIGMTLMLIGEPAFAISLGGIADNLLGPTRGITQLMYGVSYVAGGLMFIMAVLQYKAHRDNPSQVRLGTPAALLIFAIVFICIPIVSKYSAASKAAGTKIDTRNANYAPLLYGKETPSQDEQRPSRQTNTRPSHPNRGQTTPINPNDSDWY